VALFGDVSTELVDLAHSVGTRVVLPAPAISKENLTNTDARAAFISEAKELMSKYHLDGLNWDFETPFLSSEEEDGMVSLFAELRTALPSAQLSVDVAWSPNVIDGRNYRYAHLAELADFLFIMAYDERSQVKNVTRCVAG
jgi:spore germination protein YaaH